MLFWFWFWGALALSAGPIPGGGPAVLRGRAQALAGVGAGPVPFEAGVLFLYKFRLGEEDLVSDWLVYDDLGLHIISSKSLATSYRMIRSSCPRNMQRCRYNIEFRFRHLYAS